MIWFTENGELISGDRIHGLSTYYCYRGLVGRQYPVVGGRILRTDAMVHVNFGNDGDKPFKWRPGNADDSGCAYVYQKEEELLKTPLDLSRRVTAAA
jgi:hypothetical protein